MAEYRTCKLCGFSGKRCGITNHLKAKHPNEFSANRQNATETLTSPISPTYKPAVTKLRLSKNFATICTHPETEAVKQPNGQTWHYCTKCNLLIMIDESANYP